MIRYKVIKTGKKVDSNYWVIVQKKENGKVYHSQLTTSEPPPKPYIEIPPDTDKIISWTESRSEIISSMMDYPSFLSEFNFGMFKGYEIGLVYAYYLDYIQWCIETIGDFAIRDLNILQEIGVFRKPQPSWYQGIVVSRIIKEDKPYNSIMDIIRDIPVLNSDIRLPEEIFELNQSKLKIVRLMR